MSYEVSVQSKEDPITGKDKKAIHDLVELFFRIERSYYNSAEDVQIVPLKRYLYHQSSIRNRWTNEILTAIKDYDILLSKSWIDKGHTYRSAKEDQEFLENRNYTVIVQLCLESDFKVLPEIDRLLLVKGMPIDILEALVRVKTELLFEISESKELIEEIMERASASKDAVKGKIVSLYQKS
ncbi:hypothetical protein NBT05_16285 [Aquimarina sp. ERC-38]|uniref:hypothetical protein n=1 Tax=Aquimarina sp. ERC-38 TaxID=2949996 RepID=UPI0022451322|nr:hypothetical protein [Aquimarina sp. ERC-38]UZO80495.1 hypothetical protein NBT05_16285 [Aquimarina sp. ERC-38]